MNKEKIERVIEYLESYDIENHEDADVHNNSIKICKESLEREKNEPLTLEQLEGMVEDYIVQVIQEDAIKMGFNEVVFMDRSFILAAIQEKMMREGMV